MRGEKIIIQRGQEYNDQEAWSHAYVHYTDCSDSFKGFIERDTLNTLSLSAYQLCFIKVVFQNLMFLLIFVWLGYTHPGFSSGASGKEPACQCKRPKKPGFSPWVGKIRWRRKWQPTPVYLPGESHGRRSLLGYSPWGHKESDTTEAT